VVASLRVAHMWRRGNVSCVVQARMERDEDVLLFIAINQKDNNRHDEADTWVQQWQIGFAEGGRVNSSVSF